MNEKKIKVYMCSNSRYPFGSPTAMRLQYLAKTLQAYGMDPFIITNGKNIESEYSSAMGCYVHNGIKYFNVLAKFRSIKDLLFRAKKTMEVVRTFGMSETDIMLMSTSIPFYANEIMRTVRKEFSGKVVFDMTEWYQPFQFKKGKFNPIYQLYMYHFKKVMPKGDCILVISRFLENHFTENGCNTFRIPILTDTSDYKCNKREFDGKINIIYPGNPGEKDDFSTMLKGIAMLSENELKSVTFNLTSVTKEMVETYLGNDYESLNKLKDVIQYHGWMEYDDLIDLYNKAHFVLIAKRDNILSKSNFPSKVPELMACGVVPIITNVGDITEMLDESNSIIFNDCTKESVFQAIHTGISLDEGTFNNMSENAHQCAEKNFNYRNWVNLLGDFLLTNK